MTGENMVRKKIVFVCTGNTCRSSMAGALARHMLSTMHTGEMELEIESAGTMALPGMPAAENAIKVLAAKDIDLKAHAASILTPEKIQKADLVLTMTVAHRLQASSLAPECQDKIFTLAEYTKTGSDILDPFGGTEEIYRQSAWQIERQVKRALEIYLAGLNGEDKPAGENL